MRQTVFKVLLLLIAVLPELAFALGDNQEKTTPAGNMLICALQANRAAFATDYFGNLIFCVNDQCQLVMARPGASKPLELACINDNHAYIAYSNKKLYRCSSIKGCTEQKLE